MDKLSIVIPTYNERGNIEKLIPRLEETLHKNGVNSEIIIIDDNSNDQTAETSQKFNEKYENIRTIVRKDERGISSAWYKGFDLANGNWVACIDADLCHKPEDLVRMYFNRGNADIIIGSRYLGIGRMDKSFFASIASKYNQYFVRLMLKLHSSDVSHSFRIFKKQVFEDIKHDLHCEGNVFLAEFLYKAAAKGYKTYDVPITYGKREYGVTKLNLFKTIPHYFWNIIKLRLF